MTNLVNVFTLVIQAFFEWAPEVLFFRYFNLAVQSEIDISRHFNFVAFEYQL